MLKAVVSAAILIVAAVLGIQLISSTETLEDGWSYDDYRLDDSAVSATGSLELVQSSLGQYVHARDVGPGTIVYADGSRSVEVAKADLDVYLMAGQSNGTQLVSNPATASPKPAPGTAYAYMTADGIYGGNIDDAAPCYMLPMVSPDGECLTADKAPPFAATVYEKTGHKVYWICGAYGGRGVESFEPDGGSTWRYMTIQLGKAMSEIDLNKFTVHLRYYLWIQGEHDNAMPIEEYKEHFMEMHEAILNGRLGYRFTHCFLAPPSDATGGNATAAQRQLAVEHPDTITLATDAASSFTGNGELTGPLHHKQPGDNIIGVGLGDAVGEYLGYQGLPQSVKGAIGTLSKLVPLLIAVGVLAAMSLAIIARR